MDTQRGHALLNCETKVLRPVAFRSGDWKSFLNAHWGFAQGGLACEPSPRYSPDPWGARFAHCPMQGRIYGDDFDGRANTWETTPKEAIQAGTMLRSTQRTQPEL